MAGGPPPHPHPSRGPRRLILWPTRRMSALCPKPGSKWSNNWVVAQLVRAVQGLCSMWRGPPTPGCRILCPLTWTSGGHSSSWPESLTAPSYATALEGMLPAQDVAVPHGRGPWYPVHALRQAVLHPGPGRMPATPEVPAFGLLHLLTPWPSCPRMPGARG